jgi:hypothetical protein
VRKARLNVGRSVKPQRCEIPVIDVVERGSRSSRRHRSRRCARIRWVTVVPCRAKSPVQLAGRHEVRAGDRVPAETGIGEVLGDVGVDLPQQVGARRVGQGGAQPFDRHRGDQLADLVREPGGARAAQHGWRGDEIVQHPADDGAQPSAAGQRLRRHLLRFGPAEPQGGRRPGVDVELPVVAEAPHEGAIGLVDREVAAAQHRLASGLAQHGLAPGHHADLQVRVAVARESRGAHAQPCGVESTQATFRWPSGVLRTAPVK